MNPYAPPESSIERPKTNLTFYSVGQITVAAFIGAPVAACILIAHNYRQVDCANLGKKWLISGFIGTGVLSVVSYFLPDNFPNMAIPIGYTIGFSQAAKGLRSTHWLPLVEPEARQESWLKVIGIALLSLVLLVLAIFAILLMIPEA